LTLGRVAQQFPHDDDGRDIAEHLKREFLGVDDETYQRDIRPWLGERLAAAAWSRDNTSASACSLAALAASDEGDAQRSLRGVQERQGAAEFGYVIQNGYALVARCDGRVDSQAAASDAAARAATQSLAQLPAFRQALSELPGHPAAVAWADVAAVRAIQAGSALTIAGLTLPDAAQTGLLVAGLEATDHGLDVSFRLSGAGAPHATVDVLARLGAQPDNTGIGVSTDLQASTVVSQTAQSLAAALAGGPFASPGTGLAQALGSVLTVAVTPPASTGGSPPWQLTADTASPDRAIALAVAFGLPGLLTGVSVRTDGNIMTATSRGYQPSAGHLADSATFARAMESPIARPAVAAYVDVATLMPTMRLTAQEAASLKPIQAAGIVVGDDRGAVAGLIRLLIPS
jgi:hypothetical protein